ncbi:MAG: hypothetical protein ACI83B_001448 [Sediminicola sp.]|jgi:ribosomal protein L12E/L44/L45/RPP1/RPP2
MAKDLTKYSVAGIANGLGKARLVQKVVEDYSAKMKMSFSDLQEVWFDDLQGGNGVIRKLSDIDDKNKIRYYVDSPITLSDNSKIAICNQWGKHNLPNFILHAGLLGYEIVPESDAIEAAKKEQEESSRKADVDTQIEKMKEKAAELSEEQLDEILAELEEEEEAVPGSPGYAWKTPHALAYIIRHTMLADGEVIEGELNWMQVAFDEYDEQGIEVRDVWDDVDEEAQSLKFKLEPYANYIFNNCILYLNDKLEGSQKSRLIQILMQICAQDNLISKEEYVTLILIARAFFPGQEHEGVTAVLERAGIQIDKSLVE